MANRFSYLVTIGFNCLPIIGVAFYNWMPFEMFWLFWVETLIISCFNCIRILFSQGYAANIPFAKVPLHFNVYKALRYLLGRILVFLFYSLFIIIFIGFLASPKDDAINVVKTLAFSNRLFNLALILCVVTQGYYLVRYFLMNRAYFYSGVADYPVIFDGRQIVIHVAVVLGAVGSTFLFKDVANPRYAAVWIIATLCLAKCVYEILSTPSVAHAQPDFLPAKQSASSSL